MPQTLLSPSIMWCSITESDSLGSGEKAAGEVRCIMCRQLLTQYVALNLL